MRTALPLTLILTAAAVVAVAAAPADAAPRYVYANPQAFIAQGVVVPAGSETFYVSGIPGTPAAGATEGQTAEVLGKLGAVLKANGYGLADVVNMKVYLVGDPALGGKMDFAGMNTAFKKVFGVDGEPNKPSRVTVQISGLALPGSLVEIELTAAKSPK